MKGKKSSQKRKTGFCPLSGQFNLIKFEDKNLVCRIGKEEAGDCILSMCILRLHSPPDSLCTWFTHCLFSCALVIFPLILGCYIFHFLSFWCLLSLLLYKFEFNLYFIYVSYGVFGLIYEFIILLLKILLLFIMTHS